MNVLIDTNVLLSAVLRDRLPERVVLSIAANDEWIWIVTPSVRREYIDVLRRPKFSLQDEVLRHWEELIDLRTVNVGEPPVSVDFPRDPKDAPFLAAALSAHADWLITGDKDLLSLGQAGSTRILTAADFAGEFQIT